MVRRHDRFALRDAELDGVSVGGATVDVWEDDAGLSRWSARVFIDIGAHSTSGRFTGSTRDGRRLGGQYNLGQGILGPMSRRMQIVELLGQDPIAEATE